MEHDLQASIVSYLRLNHVFCFETDVMSGLQYMSHTDPRRYAFIKHHKAMGYVTGQPDLVICLKDGKSLFVELKTKKGRQSPEQKEIAAQLKKIGHKYEIWRDLSDAINFIGEIDAQTEE